MKHTIHEVTLKNGARGLLIDIPGATVMSFQFHFRAGNRFVQSSDKEQAAHIMEHMAFGANAEFSDGQAYEAEFSKNGAYHNAYTSDHSMVYLSDCADFEWERIMQLKQVAITRPHFNEEELEAEAGNVRNELNGYLNKHPRLLWPKMQQVLGEATLTYPEAIKTIANVTLKDIKQHYQHTHTSENLRFIIAGRMYRRKKRIIEMLESWELSRGERLAVPIDELHRAEPFLIRRKESSNITFGWSMVVPRRLSDAELDAMSAVNHILTGTMHSRIFGAARRAGLAYGIFSETSANEYASSWDIGAEVNLDTIEPLFDNITREIRSVLDGDITEEEIDAAKQYGIGRHQMGAQTVGQINRWYADRYFFDGHIEDYDSRPAAIAAVTKRRITETAREFIGANCWLLGGVGSGDKALMDRLHARLAELFPEVT
ncbi:MAG TPA: pitrilysin family protein [Candidatus Saccharimonadales bacterium]|jgi:predicted Zn-dependent peptidase